jgi:PAS domain S-box-containing protein
VLRPEMVWPLWPGCAFLVAVLLLTPRKIWPILIAAGFAGFVLYDLQAGLTLRSTAWLILSDTIEVLIAALGVSYSFEGVPRLNSVKSLAKYSFFAIILAPLSAAFIGTVAFGGNDWTRSRIDFFTEALALLTLTPAILSWVSTKREWARKPRAFYVEAAALIAGLVLLGYVAFMAPGRSSLPALLYSLLPFLLWSALRFGSMGISTSMVAFGSMGISTSMVAVAFLSIWGAVHGRGPFTGSGPLHNVLSLQLFLFFAATPFMVLAVLVEERKQAEQVVRESQSRLAAIVASAMDAIITVDNEQRIVLFNAAAEKVFGCPAHNAIGNSIECFIPHRFRHEYSAHIRRFGEDGVTNRTMGKLDALSGLQANGEEFPIEASISHVEVGGKRLFTVVIRDVTERKLAEQALASVSRRLIEAQEKERTRIARELHDDIGQRLALLAIELQQLQQSPANLSEVRSRMGELRKQTSEIATDVQSMSHGLHSSKLEYLGIAAAMRGFCQEFGEQQKVEIDFKTHDLPSPLSPDIALGLFRVLQEALHNAAKHSEVRHFAVQLWGMSSEIHLTVSDSGAGFDPEVAKQSRGLGLISMEERLKLLDGTFSIESQPKCGTTIHARVPLAQESKAIQAAG